MKSRRWVSSRKMEDASLSPVCDSRLGDSRPGRPGCSSLGLSWIPAPEQRFGGRPGRELQGERQRLISTTQNYILGAERAWSFMSPSLLAVTQLHLSSRHSRIYTQNAQNTDPHSDSQLIQSWRRSVQLHLKQPDVCTRLWMKLFLLWVGKQKSCF